MRSIADLTLSEMSITFGIGAPASVYRARTVEAHGVEPMRLDALDAKLTGTGVRLDLEAVETDEGWTCWLGIDTERVADADAITSFVSANAEAIALGLLDLKPSYAQHVAFDWPTLARRSYAEGDWQ